MSSSRVDTRADVAHRERTASLLARSIGSLSTAATTRMESDVSWFRELTAQERSWVGMILQAGIRSFVDWWRGSGDQRPSDGLLASDVFGAAPRALAGVITLQQTVDLVRLAIDVVEERLDDVLGSDDAVAVHAAIMHYGRELAFATARVYARAAEQRGAWDARLEALVVDSVVRGEADESVLSRASALGWRTAGALCVLVGPVPGERSDRDVFEAVRRSVAREPHDVLCAIQGERLVVVVGVGPGGAEEDARLHRLVQALTPVFGGGSVVVGPAVRGLASAHLSAREAAAGFAVAAGWPQAPRPVRAEDLLPERVLTGDAGAAEQLLTTVFGPLHRRRSALVGTLEAYGESRGSIEGAARALFVHPNTVRYRLGQIADLTGHSPQEPRGLFTLQMALTLGRLRPDDAATAQSDPSN